MDHCFEFFIVFKNTGQGNGTFVKLVLYKFAFLFNSEIVPVKDIALFKMVLNNEHLYVEDAILIDNWTLQQH